MSHILCAGEALIDITDRGGQVTRHVGGSVLNVAVGLARQDVRTTLASAWAGDEDGDLIESALDQAGVAYPTSCRSLASTNTARAAIDSSGNATYTFELTNEIPPVDLDDVTHLHIGSIGAFLEPGHSTCIRLADNARRAAVSVSYDINARPAIMGDPSHARPVIDKIIACSNIIKASDEDVAWLYPGRSLTSVAEDWLASGHLAIITLGGAGTIVHGRGWDEPLTLPSLDVCVVDTIGAGDSFMAGFLAHLSHVDLLGPDTPRRDQVRQALAHATATAAVTVSHAGAYAPTTADIAAM